MKRLLTVCVILSGLSVSPAFAQVKVDRNYLKAQALEQEEKYEEARDIYEQLYRSSGNDRYFWRLMLVYDRLNEYSSMEKMAMSRLKSRPGELVTMRYLASAYYGQGDVKKAHKVVMDMIGNRWNNLTRIRYAASELVTHSDYNLAVKVYLTAREKIKNDSVFSVELARIFLLQFKYIKAIEEYLITLENVTISYSNIENILKNAIAENVKPDDLARPIELYLKKNPGSIKAARLLSGLRYRTGDFHGAYEALAKAAVATKNAKDILNLAERLHNEGHLDEALMVYENFYRLFPENPKRVHALLQSASIKVDTGKPEGARNDYLILADDYRGTREAAVATLRIIELSRDKSSIEGFTKALGDFASSTKFRNVAFEAYIALAEAYMSEGKPEEAQKALSNARIKARGKKEIYTVSSRSALFHFYTGDFKSMAREIDACTEYLSNGNEINDLLSLKLLGMRCSTEADRAGFTALAHGRYAQFRGLYGEAIDSLTVAAQDTSSVAASAASVSLAELYRDSGDFENAYSWYIHAASAAYDTTERVEAMIYAADLLFAGLHDSQRARSLYMKAMTSYPGTVYESILRRKLRMVAEQ